MSTQKPILLITEHKDFSANAIRLLERKFKVVLFDPSSQKCNGLLQHTDILWVRLKHYIDRSIMITMPHLKAIVSPTTGLNHIDLLEAERRNIQIISLAGETEFLRKVRATAEMTIALILALIRKIPAAVAHTRSGGWNRNLFKGYELAGKCVGIIGHGRLGKMVSDYLTAFGCFVMACDPKPVEPPGVPLVPLSELLCNADIVSIHVSLTEASKGFFSRDIFKMVKPGAYFINTSRGELIDETALIDSLESGRIKGAALDVAKDENPTAMKGHPLIQYSQSHDNIIITPHIGGATFESMQKTEIFLSKKIISYYHSKK